MNKYKSFIPQFAFNSDKKEWVKINEEKKDYLDKTTFPKYCESFTEIATGLVYVTWVDRITPSLYKGIIEYTDEYQLILDAELKELSKDFKFNLKPE